MWYVGLDWSDTHHDVVVLDEAGHQVGIQRFAHSHQGLHHLKDFLLGIASRPEDLACIVETNHGLLITFLLEAGIPVYPVNPKTANKLRKTAGAKTDRIDAYLLAKTGRFDLPDLRRLSPDSPIIAELKTLTRDQDALIQSQTRLVNQLTACLKEYYPVSLKLFGKLHQPSTLLFLQAYPTPTAAAAASLEEIEALLKSCKYPHARRAALEMVEQLHSQELTANEVIVRAKSRLMLSLVRQLLPLLEDIKSYDKEIATLFLKHPDHDLWQSLPRAAQRLAPRLLAEWGDDRARYRDAQSVQELAGTAPVPFQSGNFSKAHKRFACLKPLRNVLYQFAWQTTRQDAWAREYYQRKRMEGKTHSMAVRCLANVWVRIIYRMWVSKDLYQAATFEAAKLAHAPRQRAA
ncbi:IS110 family transposase [Ktedonospora formicarum]|uniref:IS110 family transposase n=1 Tax=Ktedonospora formicarum TaxID=2778364 RepID=A0A8J3HX61_9CHLR|nr:IS110 family transposase [Ktedonospora formicarum]GHO42228.1 IS110 family transposase [Ktedonospora formicarum]GHO47611.1 IS110 family transposase [Ktedonospora formicarum]